MTITREGIIEKSEDNQDGDRDTESPQHCGSLIVRTRSVTVLLVLNKLRVVEGKNKVSGQKDNYQEKKTIT